MRVLRFAGYWVLPTLMGVLFVMIGTGKFMAPGWRANFARWGYPDGAYAVVGVLEVAGGLALLLPRLTRWAALGLFVILVGAVGTHIAHGETARLFTPILYVALLGAVAYLRRSVARGTPRAD